MYIVQYVITMLQLVNYNHAGRDINTCVMGARYKDTNVSISFAHTFEITLAEQLHYRQGAWICVSSLV